MTGSHQILIVLNRLGHCFGYNVAEEIETEFATDIASKYRATPANLIQMAGLATGLAWG